jgi:hypothetical protein
MYFSMQDYLSMKEAVKAVSSTVLHSHDVCGDPYFSLEEADPAAIEAIQAFLDSKGYKAVFGNDQRQFRVTTR